MALDPKPIEVVAGQNPGEELLRAESYGLNLHTRARYLNRQYSPHRQFLLLQATQLALGHSLP